MWMLTFFQMCLVLFLSKPMLIVLSLSVLQKIICLFNYLYIYLSVNVYINPPKMSHGQLWKWTYAPTFLAEVPNAAIALPNLSSVVVCPRGRKRFCATAVILCVIIIFTFWCIAITSLRVILWHCILCLPPHTWSQSWLLSFLRNGTGQRAWNEQIDQPWHLWTMSVN